MNIQTNDFLNALGDSTNVAGGGSAAALVGAVAASLVKKVYDNEKNKNRHADKTEEIDNRIHSLEEIQERLQELIDEDPKALQPLIQAYKMPKETVEEKEARHAEIQSGIETAARPQVEILELLTEIAIHQEYLVKIQPQGEIVTNLAESLLFTDAAFKVAHIGARTNYEALSEEEKREERLEHIETLLTIGRDRIANAYESVSQFIEEKEWS